MICSSVNRLGFMSIPFEVMDSTHFLEENLGRRSPRAALHVLINSDDDCLDAQ